MIRLKLRVDNTYTDEVYADDPELDDTGTVTVIRDAEVTEPPADDESDEFNEWLHSQIIDPHTGTGREIGDSYYDIEVLESSDPAAIPVGTTWDAGY